jgi:hypothetical protein
MSKKKDKKETDTPILPYLNTNRIEEAETKLAKDKSQIDYLKTEINYLRNELIEKDKQNETRFYNKMLEDKTKDLVLCETELSKLKSENNKIINKIKDQYEERIKEMKIESEARIDRLTEDCEHYKESNKKAQALVVSYEDDLDRLRNEIENLNGNMFNTIQSYEDKIMELKKSHGQELYELKRREEEFRKSNEELTGTDLYTVYKDVKTKYEGTITELLRCNTTNEKISDENKIFRLDLENYDGIIKKCAKVQTSQQKLIKQQQEQIESKSNQLDKIKDENNAEIKELNQKLGRIIHEKDSEVKRLKKNLDFRINENNEIRSLSQMILDQRSDVEQYFIESLEEVKMEIYKKRKEAQKRKECFPHLKKKYEEKAKHSDKVDLKDLDPEEKEKVLRLLFAKINENYKPKSYKNMNAENSHLEEDDDIIDNYD